MMRLKKIFDGSDRAREEGVEDFPALIRHYTDMQRAKMMTAFKMDRAKIKNFVVRVWDGNINQEKSLKAYINGGRWLVRCWCGSDEYASREHRFTFCHQCGETAITIFPENLGDVEKQALKLSPNVDFEILTTQQAALHCATVVWEPS